VPNFVFFFAASIAELAMEKNRILTHPLTHQSKYRLLSMTKIIWCPGNRSFRFGTTTVITKSMMSMVIVMICQSGFDLAYCMWSLLPLDKTDVHC